MGQVLGHLEGGSVEPVGNASGEPPTDSWSRTVADTPPPPAAESLCAGGLSGERAGHNHRMDKPPLPPVVYAPTLTDDDGNTRIRMHRMRDDRVALFVYSAIDRLQGQYGEHAPWVLLSVPELERAHQEEPYDVLLLDRELHPQGVGGG